MAKDAMKKSINTLKRGIDEIINSYEETPYGCVYNIVGEARRRAQAEKIKQALEENAKRELDEYLNLRKAG